MRALGRGDEADVFVNIGSDATSWFEALEGRHDHWRGAMVSVSSGGRRWVGYLAPK